MNDRILLSTLDKGNNYYFACINCNKTIHICAGTGRYGNLGSFHCPFCNREYYATIDDNPQEHVYIWDNYTMPHSLLDNDKPAPIYELIPLSPP